MPSEQRRSLVVLVLKKQQCGGACVVDRLREIALTSVVCKVSVNTGLRQGCVFLPLSFSLYINGL